LSKISVVMIVYNEARRIEPALESVKWADEVIIIDAFSSDDTVSICRKYTSHVYQYPWEGYARQRERSIAHATHPWIFSLDADEVVSEALKQEILQTIQKSDTPSGFQILRKTRYLGRWIEHSGWFPDYQLRLFRKSDVFIEPRLVHEGFSVKGAVGRLNGILYHDAFDSIEHHLQKINTYTSLDCRQKLKRLKSPRVRWYHLIFNPLSKFLRMYLVNKGYKDGFQGFLLAIFSAFSTQLLYAKVWELIKTEAEAWQDGAS